MNNVRSCTATKWLFLAWCLAAVGSFGAARAADRPVVTLNRAEFRDRVLACWQGKCIGGTLGMPVEGQHGPHQLTYYQQFRRGERVANPAPNDDLDLQILWLKALEERGRVDARILGEYWLKYVPVDWNEYGVGKRNMRAGLLPPVSGEFDNAQWKHSNGAFCRTEIWACLAPGCPALAVRMAREDACVDHGAAEGTMAAVFLTALESAAFVESDRDRLIAIGLSMIPTDSTLARAIRAATEAKKQGKTWAEARQAVIEASEDRQKYASGWFQSPRNIAFIVVGWLYGEEDFAKTLCATVNCGDDTDTTGAAVGSILGILNGTKIIPRDWIEPIGKSIKPIAVSGFPMPRDLEEFTDRTVAMTRKILDANTAPVAVVPERPTDLRRVGELQLTDPAAAKALWTAPRWEVVWNEPEVQVTIDYRDEPLVTKPGPRGLGITLRNLAAGRQTCKLSLADLPEGWKATALPPEAALAPRSAQSIELVLTAEDVEPMAYPMKLLVTLPERTLSVPITLVGPGGQPGRGMKRVDRADLALASKGARASSDSELDREPGCTSKVIDGLYGDTFERERWHSSIQTPHPHWVQIKLPQPAQVGRVIIHWADPKGYGVRFEGLVVPAGQKDFQRVFERTDSRESRTSRFEITPVTTDTFRLVIHTSANPQYPNAAQVGEIELLPAAK